MHEAVVAGDLVSKSSGVRGFAIGVEFDSWLQLFLLLLQYAALLKYLAASQPRCLLSYLACRRYSTTCVVLLALVEASARLDIRQGE